MATKYVHTNLIANDWNRLASFYQEVFGCEPVLPERNLSGAWLDKATGFDDVRIQGMHLRLPGHGENGPTLEIFQYGSMPKHPNASPNTPGFAHIAFEVDDVQAAAGLILEHGGTVVGEFTELELPGVGRLTFQYLADLEGNIVEVQNWQEAA
ncbi:VOC family protein [Candidatus Bipolaricaulota bacterium]